MSEADFTGGKLFSGILISFGLLSLTIENISTIFSFILFFCGLFVNFALNKERDKND